MTPAPQVMTSAAGDYSRNLWLVPGPRDSVHPLCLFLDAEHYLRDMDCLPLISKLMADGQIPPLTLAFVSHVSSEDRQRDYLWNPRYAQFLAEEVVPWVCARSNARAEGNLICGLSLSGLAAAHVAFQYPGLFSQVFARAVRARVVHEDEVVHAHVAVIIQEIGQAYAFVAGGTEHQDIARPDGFRAVRDAPELTPFAKRPDQPTLAQKTQPVCPNNAQCCPFSARAGPIARIKGTLTRG